MLNSFFSSLYIFAFFSILLILWNRRLDSKSLTLLLCFFVLALVVIAYKKNPVEGWDIYRLWEYLNDFRRSNENIFSVIKRGISGGESKYDGLVVFNIICLFFTNTFESNRLFSSFFILFDYVIVSLILLYCYNKFGFKCKEIIFSLSLTFCYMPYLYAYSGIRNAMAMCIVAILLVLINEKKIKIIYAVLLGFSAITIHPSSIVSILFIFLSKYKPRKIGIILLLATQLISNFVFRTLRNSSSYFLRDLSDSYFEYSSEGHYNASGRVFLYSIVIITSLCIALNILKKNGYTKATDEKSEKTRTIDNFLLWYMWYIIGNVGYYDLLLRPAYLLGPLSPFIVKNILSCNSENVNKKISLLISVGIFILAAFASLRGIAQFMAITELAFFKIT